MEAPKLALSFDDILEYLEDFRHSYTVLDQLKDHINQKITFIESNEIPNTINVKLLNQYEDILEFIEQRRKNKIHF